MKLSKQKHLPSKLKRTGLALASMTLAFVGWGYLSHLSGGKSANDRETLLSEARVGGKKTDSEGGASILMNDPFMKKQKWGLEKTAAGRAWEITKGSKDIVVAVIDTGIDKHKDLVDNLWTNPGESGVVQNAFCSKQKNPLELKECNKATNGIDDDANGFIDDVHGWNFVQNNNLLYDNHGHGTHISGIIGAHSKDSDGVSGVAPKVSIMTLKYFDPKVPNTNNLKNTIDAIRYAVKMKANIINYSGGGTDYSPEEFAAIKEAEQAGVLVVAAAGNERSNSDEAGKHYYPADYDLTNIISVTAVNKEETKVLPSSNYGVRTVDLAAPGENIYSTLPNNGYGLMTGTSQATAFVTGVAVLILAHNPDFSASDVKKYVLRTGDEYPTLLSKTGTAKLLNSYRALTSLDMGVSVSGVVAANTAKVDARAFAANTNLNEIKFDTSALNNGAPTAASEDPNGDAESIAMFGRDFMKALNESAGGKAGSASETKN